MLMTIVSFIIVLGILVFIHEFGHFITAKKAGIKVEEFALGFGPKLISRAKGETVYSIRVIPLGGFCNMAEEFPLDEDMSIEEREIYERAKSRGQLFNQKSAWKRFAVIFMGPFMNFLLAALILTLIFAVYGLPVDSSKTTVIGDIIPQKPASEAGLQPGDKILSIDDNRVNTWDEMAAIIHQSEGKELNFSYERDGQVNEVRITPTADEQVNGGAIGIYPQLIRKRIGIFNSIKLGFIQTWRIIYFTFAGFIQMISQRSTEGIGGPVMIASIVGQAARTGLSSLLNWMAIISINLGIINLLPFPALDGGRIVFILVELVRGKPVPAEKEGFVHFIGFILLMLLMVFFTYKDIVRSLF